MFSNIVQATTSRLLLTPPGSVHIGTSNTSHLVVYTYTDIYVAIDHVSPPFSTQYTRLIAPQGRQPNFYPYYDAPRNNQTDNPMRKIDLDAPKFTGRLKIIAFLN